MATRMILHHYPMSPFSEKIRLMFGYTGMEWLSVMTSESPPRPLVEQLAGGYRRIPVAQVGADIFCDSRLIADEIASLTGRPELSPFNAKAEDEALARAYEGDIFWAAVTSIPPTRVLRKLFSELPFTQALRFLRDRAGVARNAVSKPVAGRDAVPMFAAHLQGLDARLADSEGFLGGAQPSHLDFAAVHTLWFKIVVGGLPMPAGLPHVAQWYDRMTGLGHGTGHPGADEDAAGAARETEPRKVQAHMTSDPRIGSRVRVAPSDYALDATEGVLTGIDERRCVLARNANSLGTVQVHFPLEGFELTLL